MKSSDDCIIELDTPIKNTYEYWDEYGDDIIIEEPPKPTKFILFCNKVNKFFRKLFCKCLIKRI